MRKRASDARGVFAETELSYLSWNRLKRERATFFYRFHCERQDLIRDDFVGLLGHPSSKPRLQATRNSVLMWMILIPGAIAFRKSSSSVPDPPCRVSGTWAAPLISAIL